MFLNPPSLPDLRMWAQVKCSHRKPSSASIGRLHDLLYPWKIMKVEDDISGCLFLYIVIYFMCVAHLSAQCFSYSSKRLKILRCCPPLSAQSFCLSCKLLKIFLCCPPLGAMCVALEMGVAHALVGHMAAVAATRVCFLASCQILYIK